MTLARIIPLRARTLLLGLSLLLLWSMTACQPNDTAAPPPTLQAAVAGTSYLNDSHTAEVEVLQERPWGTGQLMLYRWTDADKGHTCLAATYLTRLNNQWQAHDTATAPCQSDTSFMAASTWNSTIEAPFGPPRDTVVFGTSDHGRAVRIVWVDGQVTHVPVQNGAFLESRAGKWRVERVELLDGNNQLLQMEDWTTANVQ